MGKTLRGMNLSPGLPLSINWLPSLDDVEDTAGLEGTHILLLFSQPKFITLTVTQGQCYQCTKASQISNLGLIPLLSRFGMVHQESSLWWLFCTLRPSRLLGKSLGCKIPTRGKSLVLEGCISSRQCTHTICIVCTLKTS